MRSSEVVSVSLGVASSIYRPHDRHAHAFAITGSVLWTMAIEFDTCLYILSTECRWWCHLPLLRSPDSEVNRQ
jgi:hypothetical protein